MQITIITTGSVGDVQPFIALGKKLKQSGFKVLLAGPENVRLTCHAHYLEFNAIDIDTQTRLRRETHKFKLEAGSTLGFALQRLNARREIALQVNRAAWLASQKSDCVIYRIGGYLLGDCIAEKLGVPYIKAGLVPYTPTRQFPSFYLPRLLHLGSLGNLSSYPLASFVIWQFMRKEINEFRQNILGLKPDTWKESGRKRFLHFPGPDNLPIIYAFSPALLTRPPDWSENIYITGHWSLETRSSWQPPESLIKFLNDGQPPVYMGFGSMISRSPEYTMRTFREALKITGQRGILAGGWSGLAGDNVVDENLYSLQAAPHDWLFSHVSMAIHHGGIGTTINSLKAGLPTLVVPFSYDQPFWGRRVFESGAGPMPIPIKKLNADNLARSIQSVLVNPDYQRSATRIGQQLKSENGVEMAVGIIQQIIS